MTAFANFLLSSQVFFPVTTMAQVCSAPQPFETARDPTDHLGCKESFESFGYGPYGDPFEYDGSFVCNGSFEYGDPFECDGSSVCDGYSSPTAVAYDRRWEDEDGVGDVCSQVSSLDLNESPVKRDWKLSYSDEDTEDEATSESDNEMTIDSVFDSSITPTEDMQHEDAAEFKISVDESFDFPLYQVGAIHQSRFLQSVYHEDSLAWKENNWEATKASLYKNHLGLIERVILGAANEIEIHLLVQAYTATKHRRVTVDDWTALDLYYIAKDVCEDRFGLELSREDFRKALRLLIGCHFLKIEEPTMAYGDDVNAGDLPMTIINPVNLMTYISDDPELKRITVFT